MCGIGGYVTKSNRFSGDSFLTKCDESMSERGPDQSGIWTDGNVGFVHRRLSIIDLTEKGRQPMCDPEGRAVITFNGEIYNYPALREALLKAGRKFLSHSDTEVILQGYFHWGLEELLGKLDGMFAFALLDREKRILSFARDVFGKKPLYYYEDENCFLFASDIRPVYREVRNRLTVDLHSIDYYLSELSVPQPRTIWNEIKQLIPASFMRIDLHDFSRTSGNYWELPQVEPLRITVEEAERNTEELLTKGILKRTVSDVPIGCFLSGGVDSGLVVSLLATNSQNKIQTFSVGFNDDSDELVDARIVAERYQTDHHEINITPSIIEDLPRLLEYVGEPFADSSILPSYYVCRAMNKKLKVVLSGDGGDELFGGYPDYMLAFKTDEFLNRYPVPASAFLYAQTDKIRARVSGKRENKGAYWHYSRLRGSDRLFRQMGFTEMEKQELYVPGLGIGALGFFKTKMDELWRRNQSFSLSSTLMRASLQTRLLNDYLVKVDRASMINSLEVRSPFLDKDLAAFAFTLPDDIKFQQFNSKYLLKKLAARYFDPKIFSKPKRGFSFPMEKWLRSGFHERLEKLPQPDSPIYRIGLFSPAIIRKYVRRYLAGHSDLGTRIWLLLCLDEWCRIYY